MKLPVSLLAGIGLVAFSVAGPVATNSLSAETSIVPALDYALDRRADPGDFYLRIMPLGASITAGDYSPPEKNGYRKFTRDNLRSDGWKVNMVGNFNQGSMSDNDHEGVSGDRVDQVQDRARGSCRVWLPNVVLINAGTNDANQDFNVGQTGLRMQELINTIVAEVPDAVVVLSTLLPTTNDDAQRRVERINEQYRQVHREYVALGEDGQDEPNPSVKVVLADMASFLTEADIADGIHPNDEGNKKMAAVWVWAINYAHEKGWIKEPTDSGKFDDDQPSRTCRKELGSGAFDFRSGRQVLYARAGEIRSDGRYKHEGVPRDDRAGDIPDVEDDGSVWFAQLVNRGGNHKLGEIDEMIIARSDSSLSDNSPRKFTMFVNYGGASFPEQHEITIPDSCSNEAIRWGDLNGDGLDDFICIFSNGEMHASLNEGGNPPTFRQLGLYKSPELGKGRDRVRLGDIDGDGRLDYCVMPDSGDVHCWRNGGLGAKAAYWQDLGSGGPVFTAKGMGDMRGVQFVDINNDGRYDWLWMSTSGRVTTWINQRGSGKGMVPSWLKATNDGITHGGMGTDIGDNREHVRFGRLWDGRPSYIHWEIDDGHLTFKVWENRGSGGKHQKGDGIYWGDVTGTGFDDYIWIRSTGQVTVFPNTYSETTEPEKYYREDTNAWDIPSATLDTGFDRRALHIGDWDGDGKADIIGVNRETGGVHVWYNNWDGSDFNWDRQDHTQTTNGWCTEGWGLLPGDHGAHFADVTGSKKVDYLCMKPDGTTTAWLRDFSDNPWRNVGQVKYTEDLDRANFRFADINGDGKADLVHTDKFTGNARVWYSIRERDDPQNNAGSAMEWERPQLLFSGAARGENTFFPELSGQGRGDMVWIDPTTAHAWISFNACPGGGDDGDDPPADPGLPEYSPPDSPEPGPDPEDSWFCEDNGGTWDEDLWLAHGVGTWFLQRSESYYAVDRDWPRDEDSESIEGVPRIIAKFDGFNQDDIWNWPDTCRDIEKTCDLSQDHLSGDDDCSRHEERAFVLWALRNVARNLQLFYDIFFDGLFLADFDVPGSADDFIDGDTGSLQLEAASVLTVAAGMFTSMGAVASPGSAALNSVAGLLTIAAGMAGSTSGSPEDVRFSNFADISESLGDLGEWFGNRIGAYFDELLSTTPPDDDFDAGMRLARLLENGAFANQDNAIELNNTDVRNIVFASVISEVWNAQQVAIIKWSDDGWVANNWGFSPCYGDKDDLDMGSHIACVNERNFAIGRFDKPDETQYTLRTWPDVGQDEDTLEDYGLNHVQLINAAERMQRRAQTYKPRRDFDALEEVFDDIKQDPLAADRLTKLKQINVPVCDLDLVNDPDLGGNGIEFCQENTRTSGCFWELIDRNCRKLSLGGMQWPY